VCCAVVHYNTKLKPIMATTSHPPSSSSSSTETQPLYTIDTQHDDMIHDAQLDYYGCKLATCSSGKTPQK